MATDAVTPLEGGAGVMVLTVPGGVNRLIGQAPAVGLGRAPRFVEGTSPIL